MKTNDTLNNDIFIMKEAVTILERHFDSEWRDNEARDYVSFRIEYFKAGIALYKDTGGQDSSVASSLSNFFSALYLERPEHVDNIIWTDIKDEINRVVYNG